MSHALLRYTGRLSRSQVHPDPLPPVAVLQEIDGCPDGSERQGVEHWYRSIAARSCAERRAGVNCVLVSGVHDVYAVLFTICIYGFPSNSILNFKHHLISEHFKYQIYYANATDTCITHGLHSAISIAGGFLSRRCFTLSWPEPGGP